MMKLPGTSTNVAKIQVTIDNQTVDATVSQKTGFGKLVNSIKSMFNTTVGRTPGRQSDDIKLTFTDASGKTSSRNLSLALQPDSIKQYGSKKISEIVQKKLDEKAGLPDSAHQAPGISSGTSSSSQVTHTANTVPVTNTEEKVPESAHLKVEKPVVNGKNSLPDEIIDRLGNVATKNQGTYGVAFTQDDFIGTSTFGKNGVCHALCLTWLSAQDTSAKETFFNELNTVETRDTVMDFAIQYTRKFLPSASKADATFGQDPKMTNMSRDSSVMTLEQQYMEMYLGPLDVKFTESKGNFPVSTGKYLIHLESDQGGGHAVSINIDTEKGIFTFFDPNKGQFSFDDAASMKKAILKITNLGTGTKYHPFGVTSFKSPSGTAKAG